MESGWHAINHMDFTKGNSDRKAGEADRPKDAISQKEKSDLLTDRPGFWTWKKAAGGVAALAVVGVGAAVLLAGDDAGPSAPVDKTEPAIDRLGLEWPSTK
jgi:hypothetical protein